jgi:hypothetical protein
LNEDYHFDARLRLELHWGRILLEGMRSSLLALVVVVFGFVATAAGERFLSEYAPEWVWRLAYTLLALGGATYVLFQEPVFGYLLSFRQQEIVSTLIVATFCGVVSATLWFFWIVGFPSSLAYTNSRIVCWIKSIGSSWSVKDSPHPETYFGFYIDRTDEPFGVGVSRPKDPKEDDHLNFDWEIGLPTDELALFNRFSERQKDQLIWDLKIEVLKINPNCRITRDPDHIVYIRRMVPINKELNARTISNSAHECFSEFKLITLTLDKLLIDISHRPTQPSPTPDMGAPPHSIH